MPYIPDPRGGATRDYYSVPKVEISDPIQFDPENLGAINDTTVNQYKGYTDTLLYAILFFALIEIFNKLKDRLK